jgi:hypothetical protein
MASKGKTRKADPVREAAADYFAARSHAAWRRRLLKTNPTQKDKPRMRLRGGVMVDVNQPWSRLHAKAKADNMRAAYDAYAAVQRFPDDREAAAAYVHERWIKRNRSDQSQPKALFKPYAKLPEVEKDKDRAHVDKMKKALAVVRKSAGKTARPAVAKKTTGRPATRLVRIDARAWRRLELAARDLSKKLGREVPVEALANASIEAMAAVFRTMPARPRAKKR